MACTHACSTMQIRVSLYCICRRRVAREVVHNHTKHVFTPPRLPSPPGDAFSSDGVGCATPGIRIDGFTNHFRLYAWDNGHRSELLFAVGRKYASVLAPLFHGNAPEPTLRIRRLFLHFRQRERRFLFSFVLSTVARPRPSSAVFLAERDDLYRDRRRRAARSVLVLDTSDFV